MPKVFRYYKGTRAGGLKAAETNRKKYGKDFYHTIGRKGGSASHIGGFNTVDKNGRHTLAQRAGRKGGTISRRGPAKPKVDKKPDELGPIVSSIERKYRKEHKSFFKRLFKR